MKSIANQNLVIVLLVSLSVHSFSQENITPDKKYFEIKWMQPHEFQMDWYAERNSQRIKLGTVATQVLIDNKKIKVVTEVKMQGRNLEWKDTTIAEAESFEPIYHSSYNPNRDMILSFRDVITGSYHDKQRNERLEISDTTHSHQYFDSNIYPLLIRLLPLKAGYTCTFPIYDYHPKKQKGITTARVETVEDGFYENSKGKKVDVWIVTVSDELNLSSNSRSIYFIGKDDRKLWKQIINTNASKMEMILIE